MVRISSVVAQEFWIIPADIDGDADAPVVEKIRGSKAAAHDRAQEVGTERVGRLLEVAIAQVAKHQERLLVRDLCMIEIDVI